MSRAVDVGIMPFGRLVLDVRCGDGDSSLALLGCLVDLVERHGLSQALLRLDQRYRCGQSGLAVIDVTDRSNVYVRLCSLEFRFSHSFLYSLVTTSYTSKLAIGIEPMTSSLPRMCSAN